MSKKGARAGSGSSAGLKRTKNANMAAYMKKHKIERHTANCCMCHKTVGLGAMERHVISCKGS